MAPKIAIIGTGRVAFVLGQALRQHGVPIVAVAGRSETQVERLAQIVNANALVDLAHVSGSATHVLVAVSDDALEHVLQKLSGCDVVLHTSGAAGPLKIAAIAAVGVLHPLQTFPDTKMQDLSHCTFAYGGDPEAQRWALELIHILGAKCLHIASEKWAEYHAAAVFASNYQITLLDAAIEMMQLAGVSARDSLAALEPLTRAAIDNSFQQGTTAALTGPIRRGDVKTVQQHLSALHGADRYTRDLYRAAARRTLTIAARAGADPKSLRELEEHL